MPHHLRNDQDDENDEDEDDEYNFKIPKGGSEDKCRKVRMRLVLPLLNVNEPVYIGTCRLSVCSVRLPPPLAQMPKLTLSPTHPPQHLRVWLRRLQSTAQSLTEHQQLGSTRTRQRTVAASSTDNPDLPYTWVQCSSPSCGKWRALARGIELKDVIGEVRVDEND